MSTNDGRDDRGMETGSRERSRAETQGDGDKRSLADDKLRPASAGDTGSRDAGFDATAGGAADRSGSERSGKERMVSEGGTGGDTAAREQPREDVRKINHGDKYDAMIPRGTDEHAGGPADEGERR